VLEQSLHTGQGMQQSELQALRQACRKALHVEFWRVAPFRLQEYLPSRMSHISRAPHNVVVPFYDDQAGLFRSLCSSRVCRRSGSRNSSQAANYEASEPEPYNRMHWYNG